MHINVDVRLVDNFSVKHLVGISCSRTEGYLLANELFNDILQSQHAQSAMVGPGIF